MAKQRHGGGSGVEQGTGWVRLPVGGWEGGHSIREWEGGQGEGGPGA